jgi:hypothetical protein
LLFAEVAADVADAVAAVAVGWVGAAVVAAEVVAAAARAGDGVAFAEFHNVARERQEPGELPGRAPLGRRSGMIFRGGTCFGS